MTLSELLDALDDIGTQLDQCVAHKDLDDGQRLMLSEAQVRIAQTRKELMFDAAIEMTEPAPEPLDDDEDYWGESDD